MLKANKHSNRSKEKTSHIGRQFPTALDLIEIDITYECNLKCFNCDRSCTQAPDNLQMTVDQIQHFVRESKTNQRNWRRIRVLGGEPFLHPQVFKILSCLCDALPQATIEVVTNGFGKKVKDAMTRVPNGILVKNTTKINRFQKKFEAFNLAPMDLIDCSNIDFTNGCWITEECGIGLNLYGYYQCGVASSIDRVMGFDIGLKELPNKQIQFMSLKRRLCPYCGHFFNRRFIPPEQRKPVDGEPQSKSWKIAYFQYNLKKSQMTIY